MRLTATLSLPRQPASVSRDRHVLNTLLDLTDVADDRRGHLAVVISEACANAVTHASEGSTIDVTITNNDHLCVLEISNPGTNSNGDSRRATRPTFR